MLKKFWKLWHDPVGSKVIAGIILLIIGGAGFGTYLLNLWPVIVQFAKDAYTFALSPTSIPNWIIGALGLLAAATIIRILWFRQVTPSTSATGWSGPKTIERAGVRFDLEESIYSYLGKFDPINVPSHVIDDFLQGPFCQKCHHTLVFWNTILRGNCVEDVCPNCKLQWHQSTGSRIHLQAWKARIYQSLDAEFRRDRKLADSDKQA